MNGITIKSIITVLIALLIAAASLITFDFVLYNMIPEDTEIKDTTISTEMSGFIPSPEVKSVYVVDNSDYYHENVMCGAINTLIGYSEMSKDLAIQLKFKPCEICCE